MRLPALVVVVLAIVVPLCGCAAGVRPDAEVARNVERAELRLAETQGQERAVTAAALASADDVLPVALPAPGEQEAAAAAAAAEADLESAGGTPDADDFSFRVLDPAGFPGDSEAGTGGITAEQKRGLPRLRLQLLKFNLNGVPVDLKCSLKHKYLMFGAKFTL